MSISLFSDLAHSNDAAFEYPVDKRIEKFLKHVMIENCGIYTLVGSKPMTAFDIFPVIDNDEKKAIYEAQSERFRKHIRFEKFNPSKVHCKQLWRDWKQVEKKHLSDRFLFVEFQHWDSGIFINIPAVTTVLKKYYADFVNVIGQDFNPSEVIYKIGDSSDPFWSKVEKNHYLLGLLFGFGEKNSQHFQWESKKGIHYPARRPLVGTPSSGKNPLALSIEDITLPRFIVYEIKDAHEERYLLERKTILQIYKDKNFTETTVRYLKGEESSQLSH